MNGGIDAGELDRRITILRAESVDNGTATVSGEPVSIGRRWARKQDVSDGERVRASQQGQTLTTRFLVRHDSLTSTITGKDVILCEGVTYQVIGTKEWGGAHVGVEITASSQPDIAP